MKKRHALDIEPGLGRGMHSISQQVAQLLPKGRSKYSLPCNNQRPALKKREPLFPSTTFFPHFVPQPAATSIPSPDISSSPSLSSSTSSSSSPSLSWSRSMPCEAASADSRRCMPEFQPCSQPSPTTRSRMAARALSSSSSADRKGAEVRISLSRHC